MVQSSHELGLARASETIVKEGQGVSGVAVDLGHRIGQVLQAMILNLGSCGHHQRSEDDDAVLSLILALHSSVLLEEFSAHARVKLLADIGKQLTGLCLVFFYHVTEFNAHVAVQITDNVKISIALEEAWLTSALVHFSESVRNHTASPSTHLDGASSPGSGNRRFGMRSQLMFGKGNKLIGKKMMQMEESAIVAVVLAVEVEMEGEGEGSEWEWQNL